MSGDGSLIDDPAIEEAARRRRGWELFGGIVRDQWRGLAVGIGAGVAWTLAKISVPLLVRLAIDRGIETEDLAALARWVAAIAVAGVIAAFFTGMRRYHAFKQSRLAETRMRDRLYAQIMRLQFEYHDRMQTGELMSRANTDLQQLQHVVVLIPLTVSNAVTVLGVVILLGTIDPWLTLLALGSLPLLNVLGRRFSTLLHPAVMGIQRESAEFASVVEETVSGVRVIRGFGAESVMARRLEVEAGDVYDQSMAAAGVRATYLPAMELLPSIGLLLVLWVGGNSVLDGDLSIGEFTAFNLYVVLLIWPLRMLGSIIAQTQRAIAAGARVAEVLDEAPTISSPSRPARLPSGALEVEFDDVYFGYGDGPPILRGLSLDIPAGEMVALVGQTGSGKSTIMRLLARYYDTDRGEVRVGGSPVRVYDRVELRRTVGVVFEETFLFSDTVAANIAFGRPMASRTQIERAADLAGASEFIGDLPAGYATEVGERGYGLSGGQRQRLAIARAILTDPGVLILDDATSAVDASKEHEIHAAIQEVVKGRTTLVIAHRPSTIALADRVVLLDDGRVSDTGSHEELLDRSERYRQVLAAEAPEAAEVTEP